MQKKEKRKILFVCSGNICRSPLAHRIFEKIVKEDSVEDQFEIDSCGTESWNIGHNADKRMRELAKQKGWILEKISRQICLHDIEYFDHIFAMDKRHLYEIKNMFSTEKATCHQKLKLFRTFDLEANEEDNEVMDPYYGGIQKFTQVYEMIERTCENLFRSFATS